VALLEIFADVVHFCEKENSGISAAVQSLLLSLWKRLIAKEWLKYRRRFSRTCIDIFTEGTFHISFPSKKPATCGCNPAGSKVGKGNFSRREADQAKLLLVQLVAVGRTETIKNKSQKRKESPVEGSHGEAANRKHKNNRQWFYQG